jgi:hypothetical protein
VRHTEEVVVSVPATGLVAVPGARARAALSIRNTRTEQVVLAAGTTVMAGEVRFRTDAAVVIGPGEAVSAAATANLAGPSGNVAAGAINRLDDPSLGAGLEVANPAAASGGTTVEIPAASGADHKAVLELAQRLKESSEFRRAVVAAHPGQLVLLSTAEATVEPGTPFPAPGEPATTVFLRVRVSVSARAVEGADLVAHWQSQSSRPPAPLMAGSLEAAEIEGESIVGERFVLVRARLSGLVAEQVDPADVVNAVKAERPSSAESTLRSRYRIDDVRVELTPAWAPLVPWFESRIDVDFRSGH